jgi:hypothetical protein
MSFPFSTVYLLDTCTVVGLDGKHRPPTSQYSSAERVLIWEELETLANDGRVKLIKQVKAELKRWHPGGLARFAPYPGHRLIVKRTADVVRHYQLITTQHPDLARAGRMKFDPADPWLIVAAERHGYTVVTDELLQADRATLKGRKQREQRIPDVCKIRNVPCVKLRDLAIQLGWIK